MSSSKRSNPQGRLSDQTLRTLKRGIEKESLRVADDGMLASTPHAKGLGSPLTHPSITTDFAQAQLELITGVHEGIDDCLGELHDVHHHVYEQIDDELLWCSSMPCRLPEDAQIQVGQFGRSNLGRMKTVYRLGLGHRYGRRMQTISGIHYNFSLPDEGFAEFAPNTPLQSARTDAYFSLIRNFRRHSWLLLYLYGASPAVCQTFLRGREHPLRELSEGTLYLPYATSLRMGSLGYQSDVQAQLRISYNSLESYAGSLFTALTEPYLAYQKIGIHVGDDYRQLNDSILQIENEFYSTIRPKRRVAKGERPLHALGEQGVEYVEVRCIDLDPFAHVGIEAEQIRFVDMFLLHCLLRDSPPDSQAEIARLNANQSDIVQQGRAPGLTLRDPFTGDAIAMAEWGEQIMDECAPIAAELDRVHGGRAYAAALAVNRNKLRDPEQTPSARILNILREAPTSFFRFAMNQSELHAQYFRSSPLAADKRSEFASIARHSLREQQQQETAETESFESYRQGYLSKERLFSAAIHPRG